MCSCNKTTNTDTLLPTTGQNNGSRSLLAAQLAAQLSLDVFFPVLHVFFLIAYSGSWVRQTRAIKACHVTSATHVCMLTPATVEQHAAHAALLLVAVVICDTDFTDKTNFFDSEPDKAMSANMLASVKHTSSETAEVSHKNQNQASARFLFGSYICLCMYSQPLMCR